MFSIQKLCRPAARFALPLLALAIVITMTATATAATAQSLNVKLRSNRGDGAVYQPGDAISLTVKTNRDADLIVYEIDADGSVHVLFPFEGNDTSIEGGTVLALPEDADEQLVVEGPVGEGYIVAIASDEPFRRLPWYLRSRDPRAEELGYTNDDRETDGVTRDGKIVGDPFVAMERIRRQVLAEGVKSHSFATAYTSYYVHNEVRYPRYLCNDCHRPGYYSWWDGFDPYYANCSVFQFRVNSAWWWGPTYWTGYVPYYAYVYRTDCPPRYRPRGQGGVWYSAWDGWPRWTATWGGPLRRTKSAPPANYIPPARWDRTRENATVGGNTLPPGFFASAHDRWSRTAQPGGGVPASGIRRERIGNGSTIPAPGEQGQGRSRRGWDQGNGNGDRDNRRRSEPATPAPTQPGREARPQRPPSSDQGRWSPPPQPRQETPAPAPRNPDRGDQRPERERKVDPPPPSDPPPQSSPPPAAPAGRPKRGGKWSGS